MSLTSTPVVAPATLVDSALTRGDVDPDPGAQAILRTAFRLLKPDAALALAPGERRGFDEYRAQIATSFGMIMASFLLVATAVFWPTDAYIFADYPDVIDAFRKWRTGIGVLSALALVQFRYVPVCRRHAALTLSLFLCAGGAVCGHVLGSVGSGGAPFYPASYMLPLATVPILINPLRRTLACVAVMLSFSVPFCAQFPEFLEGSYFAPAMLVFHVFTAGASLIVGHALFVLIRANYAQRLLVEAQARQLARAREQSERLLLNILPPTVAAQLKEGAETIADAHEEVSVMFIDIVGFTRLSRSSPPGAVVEMLNQVFSVFDTLVERHGVEKIKTIGDAYMVASGIPKADPRHAARIADLALDIRARVASLRDPLGEPVAVRIGAHTGPVVAGVIGRKKFIYDLWGDTVNTASRMESQGLPGEIQITAELADELASTHCCERRGVIMVKGKGEMETFLLRGRR